MQIVQPNIRESAASWLEARSDVVKHLILYEYEDAHHCSILQQLPDYFLDSLEWGARHTGTQVVGDLCLPRLRALTLTSCGQSTSGTSSALQLEKEFSQLLHLQYLRIEPIWNRVNLLHGCLPSSLTFLHLGEQAHDAPAESTEEIFWYCWVSYQIIGMAEISCMFVPRCQSVQHLQVIQVLSSLLAIYLQQFPPQHN